MSRIRQSPLPRGRIGRALQLGRLATGMAGGALGQGTGRLLHGETPGAVELLLNPANARRVSARLAEMRGAAMKVGQLLSLEAGDWLPDEVTRILASLRDNADAMPPATLERVLEQNWGEGWERHFDRFDREPFAAASIGQVHRAVDRHGRRLAIKLQYPEVAASIDSDIANLSRLLSWLRLVPPGIDLEALLEIARVQLHEEADYRREVECLVEFGRLVDGDPWLQVPRPVEALCTDRVLAMTHLDGENIDVLVDAEAELRHSAAERLVDLTLRECLHWGRVQSDPNFANFLYDADRGTIGLLDFGALRQLPPERCRAFADLARALLDDDLARTDAAARAVGYLSAGDDFTTRMTIVELLQMAAEPALCDGPFDFAASGLMQRLGERLLELRARPELQTLPPADVLFLHRKLAGVYLLCARLNVRLDIRNRIEAALAALPNPISPEAGRPAEAPPGAVPVEPAAVVR